MHGNLSTFGRTRSYQNAIDQPPNAREDEMASNIEPGSSAQSARRSTVGSPTHPVAEPARRRCRAHHPKRAAAVGVACGECWEQAIRDDERAVILFGLPREIEPDPTYVDQVAVELAVAGHKPRLTPVEEAEAVAILVRRGWRDMRIAEWLGIRPSRAVDLRAGATPIRPGRAVA